MRAGLVNHRCAGRIGLHRLDAVLCAGLRLVSLAGSDDFAVPGLQTEPELPARMYRIVVPGSRPGCRCVWLPEKQAERLDGLRQRFSEKMVDIFKTYEVPLPG